MGLRPNKRPVLLAIVSLCALGFVFRTRSLGAACTHNTSEPLQLDSEKRSNHSAQAIPALVRHCSGSRYSNIARLAYENARLYALLHNIQAFTANSSSMPGQAFYTPKSWLKVAFMLHILRSEKHIDWLLWLDCDALIVNTTLALGDFLNSIDVSSDHDLVVAADLAPSPFNLGVIFLRNTAWSVQLLVRLLELAENDDIRNHPWWEQHALHKLYGEGELDVKLKMKIVEERWRLNAFASLNEERPDSFIWHRVNCHEQPKCDTLFRKRFCDIHAPHEFCS